MFVDSATLQDLEVVPTPVVRGTTLWSLVNRTRTRVGSEALRRRLLQPPHSPDAIGSLQQAHQAVAADARAYRIALDAAVPDDVERYLSVTWQLPRAMPALPHARKWYRQYVQDVETGRVSVAALLRSAQHLAETLSRAGVQVLVEIASDITRVLAEAEVQALRAMAQSKKASSPRHFDQTARDSAKAGVTQLLRLVGEIEALWSIGVATTEHGWTYPRVSSQFRATGLVHPFLGAHGVPNELHLAEDIRVCFVTGPNMAGKSTFLKAAGLAMMLAHIGAGVPAVSMEFVPMGALFSSVQVTDNLEAGESFYLAEVRRIGALASALAEHGSAFAVVDEPFRGTNVHDAAEATLAIITRVAAHPSALVFVASHVGEVVPSILGDARIAFLQFSADISGEQPVFDYQLREGVSSQRLGMTLLRQEGVLDRLDRAAIAGAGKPHS